MSSFQINKIIAPFFIALFFCSCTKGKVDGPEGIKALVSSLTDCTCEPGINLYSWRSKNVYVLAFKGPACDTKTSYYNENGVEFSMIPGYTFEDFLQESKLLKNIWVCKK